MIDEIRLSEKSKWLVEPTEGEYGKGWNDCNKHWIEVIKEMPKSGEWIPCSERLPDDGQTVLIQYEDGKSGEKTMAVGWMQYDYLCCWDDRITEAIEYAVAWMPLPEPHKEGESDGH